jgi:hypothetical protein
VVQGDLIYLYCVKRVTKEERSIFLDVIVSVIVRKKVQTKMFLFLNGYGVDFYVLLSVLPSRYNSRK